MGERMMTDNPERKSYVMRGYVLRIMKWLVAGFLIPAFPLFTLAGSLQVSSSVPGLHIAVLDKLPSAPEHISADNDSSFCEGEPPQTVAGEYVAGKGWRVINEIQQGDVIIVGFFSQGVDGTSGSCFIKNGNVAIFDKGKLSALIYGDEIKDDGYSMTGAVSKTNLKNTFRLREFFPGRLAVADLYYNGDVARVQPVAPGEPYCAGTAPVPDIYGKSITAARKRLMNYGWKPVPVEEDKNDPRIREFYQHGIREADSCSGTGFGFCSFNYVRDSGATLNVVTVGDDATVTDYGAECPEG
ncbi:hypothetical protein ABW06_24005 [Pluralibacter gergoviae]|uniref:Uncharacterized protein n=2 Tax=Pluralibacter gergoviae TaxID=61647 RepID=A0A0J5KTZ2_PLUGE|nr:hypothetical protein ABW06_24005 [Pluralibacter gergoviae]KMK20635.1 hypothetical protein ABW10_23670 [Pluralibacter gergoviae]